MSDPYGQMPEPQSGEYPDRITFETAGQFVEGILVDTRWKPEDSRGAGCQVLDIQLADGTRRSVFCGAASLHRQIYSLRPPIGSMIRIEFTGFQERAKIFNVQVAPSQGQPQAQAQPVQEQPLGAAAAGTTPWAGQQAPQPQAAGNGAPPWGQ